MGFLDNIGVNIHLTVFQIVETFVNIFFLSKNKRLKLKYFSELDSKKLSQVCNANFQLFGDKDMLVNLHEIYFDIKACQ